MEERKDISVETPTALRSKPLVDVKSAKNFTIEISDRAYKCPVCGNRALRGYSYNGGDKVITIDRYLLPYATEKAKMFYRQAPISVHALSRFALYFCPHDLLILDSPVFFRLGLSNVEEDEILFHTGNMDWVPVAGKGVTFNKIFWNLIIQYSDRLRKIDWYPMASFHLKEAEGGMFQSFPEAFNSLVFTALSGPNDVQAVSALTLLDRLIDGGLFAIIRCGIPFKREVCALFFDYKIIHYALTIARDNDIEVNLGEDFQPSNLGVIFSALFKKGYFDKSSLGRLMMAALKRARYATTSFEIWQYKMFALVCAELLIKAGNYDYADPKVMVRLVYYNNEAIKYLDLLLRKELKLNDRWLGKTSERLKSEIVQSISRSDVYFYHGHSSKVVQKALRLGEKIKQLGKAHLNITFEQ